MRLAPLPLGLLSLLSLLTLALAGCPGSVSKSADAGSADGRVDGTPVGWPEGGARLDGHADSLHGDVLALTLPVGCSSGAAPSCKPLTLSSPRTYQVFQRDASGKGSVQVAGTFAGAGTVVRVVAQLASSGATLADQLFTVDRSAGQTTFTVAATLAGAGWYRLFVQELPADKASVLAEGSVAQVGVGEVFLTAGQSNSVASGEKPQAGSTMTVAAVVDVVQKQLSWAVEIDPSKGSSGTPWPVFAARLASALGVPVAVAQVGCGGTSTSQWLPAASGATAATYCGADTGSPGGLYQRLVTALGLLGSPRAILWHQGESDVIGGASQADYQARLSLIIQRLATDSGKSIPWLVANASYVPGSEIDSATCAPQSKPMQYAAAMLKVRAAQQALWTAGVARRGPDTDWMFGAYRYPGAAGSCIHFSDQGLKLHGALWYTAVSESKLIPGAEAPPSTPTQPLHRYASPADHYLTPAYLNPPPSGYTYEGIGLKVYATQASGAVALYPCRLIGNGQTKGQHFLSTDAACETFTTDGALVGYLLGAPSPGTTALLRIYSATSLDFLSTTAIDEALAAGYVVQGLQGFVPR